MQSGNPQFFQPKEVSMSHTSFSSLRKTLVASCAALALVASAQTNEPVKVGLLSTLSGPGAGLGVDIRDGFQLAVKLNGGKLGGRATEVVVADDQASPDGAAKRPSAWSSATRSTS
jgi:branched-chain amino acid transport system substrate-binding protein